MDYIISQLRGYFPEEELRELAYWVVEECTGMTRTQILTACKDTKKNVCAQENAHFHCHRLHFFAGFSGECASAQAESEDTKNVCAQENAHFPHYSLHFPAESLEEAIEIILQKLRAHVPIQYIFGHTVWMGLDLRLTPATLIPRPETAELVEWILSTSDTRKPLRVLDIGTGSGCIAIALKKRVPLWQVTGIDISERALAVAKENAMRNGVEVEWLQRDILDERREVKGERQWDIIVSNPPYICEKERITMDKRVLDYEPSTALFVPDDDPLRFYRRIATLKAAPMLFFEINEAYGQEVCELLETLGYTNIQLKSDIYGKPRMVFGAIDY